MFGRPNPALPYGDSIEELFYYNFNQQLNSHYRYNLVDR